MENLEELLKRVENNYLNRNKREKVDFPLNGKVYEVLLLTREEKAEIIYSGALSSNFTFKELYEYFKPIIYKCFQLKELAMAAKENGFINKYYDIIDSLFEPEDIPIILDFILEKNNFKQFKKEDIEFKKK